jgi:hypothetical protein
MAQQTTSTEFDEESRLRISSFFGVFGQRSKGPDEDKVPPPPERAPKIDETIAEFDASVPVWLNQSVKIEGETLSIYDQSSEPPKLLEQHKIDAITKISIDHSLLSFL